MADKSSSPRENPAPTILACLLVLLAVNLSVFLPSMPGDFIWDDKQFISENQHILGPHFLRGFLTGPFGGFSGIDAASRRADPSLQFYRPLTSLAYWLDFKLWGLNPAGFHLTNITLHLVNAFLLFYLLLNLGFSRLASLLSALLFSVFPLHFENVSWISGRTDLLSFFWGGISVLLFLRFLSGRSRAALAFSALSFFLALLSKENIVILALVYLLVLYRQKRNMARVLSGFSPYAMGLALWMVLRTLAFGSARAQLSGRSVADFFAALGFYSWKTIFPFDLSLTVNPSRVFGNGGYILLGVFVVGAGAAAMVLLARPKKAAFPPAVFLSAFFLLLLPSLAVIFSAASISLLAWRFLYLPSAVFVSGLVWLLFRAPGAKKISVAVCFLLMLLYAAEILPKNRAFGRDETAFWLGVKKIGREDSIARFNVAIKLLPVDEAGALSLFDGILAEKDHPVHAYWRTRTYEELAIYYAFQKNFAKAESYFQELMTAGRRLSIHASFNYAYYLAFSGRTGEGEKLIQEKLRAFPLNHYALTRAAKFYLITKEYDKAAALYARDYSLFPSEQTREYLRELRELESKKD